MPGPVKLDMKYDGVVTADEPHRYVSGKIAMTMKMTATNQPDPAGPVFTIEASMTGVRSRTLKPKAAAPTPEAAP